MSAVPIQTALQIAVEHLRAGRLAETESISRKILAQDQRNYDALHLLGSVAYQIGRYDDAIELFSKAVELKKNAPELISNLGWAYLAAHRHSNALAQADAVLQLDANNI